MTNNIVKKIEDSLEPAPAQGEWDEVKLEEAMQRLKLLHVKMRMLRGTIPRMMQPLAQKQPSPDVMFQAFIGAVDEAQKDLEEFTTLMNDDTTRKVFEQVEKSRENDPMGIQQWRPRDHPNWFNLESKDS